MKPTAEEQRILTLAKKMEFNADGVKSINSVIQKRKLLHIKRIAYFVHYDGVVQEMRIIGLKFERSAHGEVIYKCIPTIEPCWDVYSIKESRLFEREDNALLFSVVEQMVNDPGRFENHEA